MDKGHFLKLREEICNKMKNDNQLHIIFNIEVAVKSKSQ